MSENAFLFQKVIPLEETTAFRPAVWCDVCSLRELQVRCCVDDLRRRSLSWEGAVQTIGRVEGWLCNIDN